jgi:hypothetical protein
MRQVASIFILCIVLLGCKPAPARPAETAQLSLDYDHSPDQVVIYADVQPVPGGPELGKECLATYQPRLRIWGDGLVYVNIASVDESPPFQWEGKFDRKKIAELLEFLEAGGFFNSWNPGAINEAGTMFRMGANLKKTQVSYEGGVLDPPLYHRLIHEHILPYLRPLAGPGKRDERVSAILKESEDCYNRIFGTATP